jgi:hypothetical protein
MDRVAGEAALPGRAHFSPQDAPGAAAVGYARPNSRSAHSGQYTQTSIESSSR